MADLKLVTVLLLAGIATAASQLIAPRLINGVPIDTLRRFPHHVTIEPLYGSAGSAICGGSILDDRSILTSARCVDGSTRLQLHLERLYSNNTFGSYTIVVNSDAVHMYPTYYDDIAVIKLPTRLIFSDTLKPISLTLTPLPQLENKLAVLPGFDVNSLYNEAAGSTSQSQQLTYAMLNVISNTKCKGYYKDGVFDEYLQLCTEGWAKNPNAPCVTDFGSGLLSGWPAKAELIGIYSVTSYDCSSDSPSVYTNVAKYASWIKSVMNS